MASEDRRRQLPWVAVGLTVTLTAAIIFALWASSLSSRTTVAVAGRDIPSGATVEIEDLRAVELASGPGAGFVAMGDVDAVVGRTVRAAIPEGTILHPGLFSTTSPVAPGMAVVGAVLRPGEYPIAGLSPGQAVGVVVTGGGFAPSGGGFGGGTVVGDAVVGGVPAAGAVAAEAVITEVSERLDSGQDARFVSLLAAEADAALIGNAAASGDLRLILLPGAGRDEAGLGAGAGGAGAGR